MIPAAGTKQTSPKGAALTSKKLLFLPFYNEASEADFAWLENSIGHSIDEAARKKYNYVRIDDSIFTKHFAAQGYKSADLYDFDKITKIARELGADGVIYGTFKPDATKSHIVVTGKILSAIDREIVAEKTVTMPVSAEMFSAVEEVSQELGKNIGGLFFPTDWGAVKRAAVLPGWGHWYKQRRSWAYFYGIAFWSSIAFTAFTTFQYFNYKIGYANLSPEHHTNASGGTAFFDSAGAQAEFDRYAANISTYGTLAVAGIIAIGVIYAANILHAWGISPDVGDNVSLVVGAQPTVPGAQPAGRFESSTEVSFVWKF